MLIAAAILYYSRSIDDYPLLHSPLPHALCCVCVWTKWSAKPPLKIPKLGHNRIHSKRPHTLLMRSSPQTTMMQRSLCHFICSLTQIAFDFIVYCPARMAISQRTTTSKVHPVCRSCAHCTQWPRIDDDNNHSLYMSHYDNAVPATSI